MAFGGKSRSFWRFRYVVNSMLGAHGGGKHSNEMFCSRRLSLCLRICLQCGGSVENVALRRKLFSGSDKTKTGRNLELLLGDVIEEKSAIICRKCSERNETLCKKIFTARENFSKMQERMESNLDSAICIKRLTKPSDEREDMTVGVKKFSAKRRALFDASETAIPVEDAVNAEHKLFTRTICSYSSCRDPSCE